MKKLSDAQESCLDALMAAKPGDSMTWPPKVTKDLEDPRGVCTPRTAKSLAKAGLVEWTEGSSKISITEAGKTAWKAHLDAMKARTAENLKAKEPLKHTQMSWDWKDQPSAEDLQELLKPFGVVVTEHPSCKGTDTYGFIFSNRKLTREEMKEARESF